MFKIGIIGLGIVGNAIYESLKYLHIDDINIYDKYKQNELLIKQEIEDEEED